MAVFSSSDALPLALHLHIIARRNFAAPTAAKMGNPLSVRSVPLSCSEALFSVPYHSTASRCLLSDANRCCLRNSSYYGGILRKRRQAKALSLVQAWAEWKGLQVPKIPRPKTYRVLSSITDRISTSLWLCRSCIGKELRVCSRGRDFRAFRGGGLASFITRFGIKCVGFQDSSLYAKVGDETAEGSGNDLAVAGGSEGSSALPEEDLRDDDVLPESLEGAVLQSSQAVAEVLSSGGQRALVEYLIPELENLAEDGAQVQLWELSRLFLNGLQTCLGVQRLRAIFPDAGSAALLAYRWKEGASFQISSLNDRKPVSEEDEVVVLISPDYQLLDSVMKIASSLGGGNEDDGGQSKPLVVWNPKLTSGDIGLGLTSRRMRDEFLGSFVTAYSMRPLPVGCVFRCYPRPWQVFIDDSGSPGRYILLKEQGSKPEPDDLDTIFMTAIQGGSQNNEEPSAATQAMGLFASLQRFLRALSR